MSDYISREEALSVFGDIHPLDHNANAYKAQIEKIPSADVRENIHGEWKSEDERVPLEESLLYRCSECNKVSFWQTNFCSNCGADMRGGKNEINH